MNLNNLDAARVRHFLTKNSVTILFVIIVTTALSITTLTPTFILEEIFIRFGRSSLLVLALLIPVIAGLGLNFGIVIGAIAAQMGIFVSVFFGGVGFSGFFYAFLLATPLALLFGFLVGKMFNSMKGTEMIGGLIAGFFSDGLYQFLFLFVMGGLIPLAAHPLIVPAGTGVTGRSEGVGVVVNVNLQDSIAGALDTVPMLRILEIAFFAVIAISAILLIYRFSTKKPLGLKKIAKIAIPVIALWGISWIPAAHSFLSADRLRLIYAVEWAAWLFAAYFLWVIIRTKLIEKKPGAPLRPLIFIGLALVIYGFTWTPFIYDAFMHVRLPVLTLLIVALVCLFIRWFLNTKLGQDMRTVGQDRSVAASSGINVNRIRIIATIISTVLACWGQLIFLQNMGTMATYGAHMSVGFYSVAALMVGGASVQFAGIKNALLGLVLFHTLVLLAPNVGLQLMGDSQHGEFFRLFITFGVVFVSLAMYSWSRAKGALSAGRLSVSPSSSASAGKDKK